MIDASAPVLAFDEIDSTNAEAQRRVARGETGPLWIWARRQSAGRGRRGRSWSSPAGNLYCTYLGQAEIAPAQLALLGFAAALSIAEAIEALGARTATLKWPNDVLADGRKIAGVLLESGPIEPGRLWFALGMGVNVRLAPENVAYPAASLGELGIEADLESFFASLREKASKWSAVLASNGFAPLRAAWLRRGPAFGASLAVRVGEERAEGLFETLSESGALILRLGDGTLRAFSAGEVLSPAPADA